MNKLLCALVILCFVFWTVSNADWVDAEVTVNGIITADTTWTKADSPYNLQGPVAVDKGVTLTIEPGITVNLNGHYLQVNGTLIARGTDKEKIYFNNGRVSLTSVSQQTGQAAVFENTVTDRLEVDTAITITKNQFKSLSVNGESIVKQNTIEDLFAYGSSKVTNNEITQACEVGDSATLESNHIDARVTPHGGTPKILNNKISDGIHLDWLGGQVTISGNMIYSKNNYYRIYIAGSHADITNNIIIGDSNNKPLGIVVNGIFASATITGNQVYNCQTGISVKDCTAKVNGNIIVGCDLGLTFSLHAPMKGASGAPWETQTTVDITGNTISRNTIGVQTSYYDGNATVINNNIYENIEYNFRLTQSPQNVNASKNWWGSIDPSIVNQKIYDRHFDFNLGQVITEPILTSSVSGAPAIPANIPASTFQPTTPVVPTSTLPPQNGFTNQPPVTPSQPTGGIWLKFDVVEIAILTVLVVIAVLLAVLILTLKTKKQK